MNTIETTFTSYDVKNGEGQNGTWTLTRFTDEQGKKYQTFDEDLAQFGKDNLGSVLVVNFEVEVKKSGNRTYNNNIIKSYGRGTNAVVPKGNVAADAEDVGALKRMEALKLAIDIGVNLPELPDFAGLIEIADTILSWADGTLELNDDLPDPPTEVTN